MNVETFKETLKGLDNQHLDAIMIHPDIMKFMLGPQGNSFFGKLKWGWKCFYLSYQDWLDAMYSEDFVEEFFDYLGYSETYD